MFGLVAGPDREFAAVVDGGGFGVPDAIQGAYDRTGLRRALPRV
ncbi:MAG TPA: hypothetical protein VHZ03_16020 [Trebonia sp.]|nr:hypothetical protein [Trebonia sp.]